MTTPYRGTVLGTLDDPVAQVAGQYLWEDGTIRDGLTSGANILSAAVPELVHTNLTATLIKRSNTAAHAGAWASTGITGDAGPGSGNLAGFAIDGTAALYTPGVSEAVMVFHGGSIGWGLIDAAMITDASVTAAKLDLTMSPTWTGSHIWSKSGAASLPTISITGTPFAGTGTTSFPLVFINETGATAATDWDTAGTYFGMNIHGSGTFANWKKDGVTKFKVDNAGHVTVEGVTSAGATGTVNFVFSASPTFSGTVSFGSNGYISGSTCGFALVAHTSGRGTFLNFQDSTFCYFLPHSASTVAMVVQGKASQSAALMQLQGISSVQVREQVDIDSAWATSTDATRKARGILRVWDTAAREAFRGEASGTVAMIGFFGGTAVVQQANASQAAITAVTDANAKSALQAIYNLLVAYGLAPATA